MKSFKSKKLKSFQPKVSGKFPTNSKSFQPEVSGKFPTKRVWKVSNQKFLESLQYFPKVSGSFQPIVKASNQKFMESFQSKVSGKFPIQIV